MLVFSRNTRKYGPEIISYYEKHGIDETNLYAELASVVVRTPANI